MLSILHSNKAGGIFYYYVCVIYANWSDMGINDFIFQEIKWSALTITQLNVYNK